MKMNKIKRWNNWVWVFLEQSPGQRFCSQTRYAEVHSKKFWNAKINICMLHGGHLQICFSELSTGIFFVRYPTWLNCHLKVSICNGVDCIILGGGEGIRLSNLEYFYFLPHIKQLKRNWKVWKVWKVWWLIRRKQKNNVISREKNFPCA